MFYSDRDIESAIKIGTLKVSPIEKEQIQPASIDMRLDKKFLIPRSQKIITMSTPIPYKEFVGDNFILHPHMFVLASTVESVELSNDIVAFVQGRSSVGRMGLFIQNAGWVDPGFKGQITLELYNSSNSDILLEAGRRICQLAFAETRTAANGDGYSGKYQNQIGTTGSRVYQDFEVGSRGENYILSNENVND